MESGGNSENIMDLTTRRMDGNTAAGKAVIRPAKSIFSIRSLVEVEEDGMHNNNNNNMGDHQQERNDSPSLQAQKQHLQLKVSNLEEEIKEQIQENNTCNNLIKKKNEEIKEKEEEITFLKAQPKTSDSTLDSELSEHRQSMNNTVMNITTTQDFFVTPPRRNHSIMRSAENHSTAEYTLFHSPNNGNELQRYPENSIENPGTAPPQRKTVEVPQPQKDGITQQLISRITQLEDKISSALKKVENLNQKPENKEEKVINKQPDILILGDQHARNIKTTITKSLPNTYRIHETFIVDGTFSQIHSTDNMEKCQHLVLMAGSNDVQKTPMKDIKSAIEAIFNKYQESTIHFIQIPFRYDNVALNYHINNVNYILSEYVRRFRNVKIYETQNIIENWDYTGNNELNRHGKIKICREVSKNIKFPKNSYKTPSNKFNGGVYHDSQNSHWNRHRNENKFKPRKNKGNRTEHPAPQGTRYFHRNNFKQHHGFRKHRNQEYYRVHPVSNHHVTSRQGMNQHQQYHSTQSAHYNHHLKDVNSVNDYDQNFPDTLNSDTHTRTVDYNYDNGYYFY
ncbi:hypothetical protein M8J75_013723 [Diaphorina citri]|nr:hypothetical protein M8J75_013723 [Diaphorina citri]